MQACPFVGIDVGRKFSYYAVVRPDGTDYSEPFKADNNANGLNFVLNKLQNVEKTLGKPILVIESTGHYSSRLVYFFTRYDFKIMLVNPLQSHAIKTCSIRKVKTDKMDCRELARLPLMTELIWFVSGLLFEKLSKFFNRIQVTYDLGGTHSKEYSKKIVLLNKGKDLLVSLIKFNKYLE